MASSDALETLPRSLSDVSIYTDAVEFDLSRLEEEEVLPVGLNLGGNVFISSYNHDWVQTTFGRVAGDPKVEALYSKEALTTVELQHRSDQFDHKIAQLSVECAELERRNLLCEEELRYLLDCHLKRTSAP